MRDPQGRLGFFRPGARPDPATVLRLIDEHQDRFGAEPVLRELHIPASTYYRWRRNVHKPCERWRHDAELTEHIRRIHADSDATYGSPRIHAVLRREGTHVGRKRVERLMRQAGLQGVSPRRPRSFTRRDPAAESAPDLVQRDFTANAPNRLWVADISLIPTGEGPWWLASIRDAFSRRIVGWHTSERADADLVLTALEYALHGRPIEPGKLIHHSDHGCQYTSIKLTTRLLKAGIEPSMGSVGDSFDNALAENFWSVLKTECVRRTTFATRTDADLALFAYIDGWYNTHRIQKRLGWLSPDEYETKYYADQATAEPVAIEPPTPALTR
ncbi:IS3 family transposase [Kitasatospora sp. NPDC051853]|uniref:IS3 family transposase n=1 Tax=Kitasatospora sp. NPDC051853 TaxID=3364058 RepID=UPI003790A967